MVGGAWHPSHGNDQPTYKKFKMSKLEILKIEKNIYLKKAAQMSILLPALLAHFIATLLKWNCSNLYPTSAALWVSHNDTKPSCYMSSLRRSLLFFTHATLAEIGIGLKTR